MFFTMTMSCLIVFIYLKRRISILAVLVSGFLLFVFLVYVIKIILVLNIPPCANLSRHALGLLTATVTPWRNFTKTTLSKTHANLGERYFWYFDNQSTFHSFVFNLSSELVPWRSVRRPSTYSFKQLLKNHWTKFNQT